MKENNYETCRMLGNTKLVEKISSKENNCQTQA
jgi:hypothetical protein